MKKVLVTGAEGALGRAVIAGLRATGDADVHTASRHDPAHRIDLRSADALATLVALIRPDWVLHLAATFSNAFDEAYGVNVEPTRRLLEAVAKAGDKTRILLVGSAAEYGVVRSEDNPVREDHPLNPVSNYGLSKAWQTQLAGLFASQGVDVVVARLFNLEGPKMSERLFVGRVQQQIEEIRGGQRSALELGPMGAVRDYVKADEAARQILAIAAHGERGRVYHVASGQPTTMRDLLRRMLAEQDMTEVTVHESVTLTNRTGIDVPAIYADMTQTDRLVRG